MQRSRKITQPQKYPIETGMALDTLSDLCWTVAGTKDASKLGGILNLAADINMIVGKEDTQSPNPHAKGSVAYYATELRRRPVMASSLLNITGDLYTMAGGVKDYLANPSRYPSSLLAGGFLLAGNLMQAIYVDKNDYNIEVQESSPQTVISQPDASRKIMAPEQPVRAAFA